MRHVFTKSEQLALELITHFGFVPTEINSGSIQREQWIPWLGEDTELSCRRMVHRAVTLKVRDDHCVLRVIQVDVYLKGWEHQVLSQQDEPGGWTTWAISRVELGSLSDEGTVWRGLRVPDIDEESGEAYRFPHHLFTPECVGAVPSTDA